MPSKIILQLPFGLFRFTANPSAVSCPSCSPEILTHTFSPVPGAPFFARFAHAAPTVFQDWEICLPPTLPSTEKAVGEPPLAI